MDKPRADKAVFNWSGGKDSALALWMCLQDTALEISCLLTNINSATGRISMHGVRKVLLEQQASATGLPLRLTELPEQCSMQQYDEIVRSQFRDLKKEGISESVFGDIFLEDLKAYRIDQMKQAGFRAHFPLWKQDTVELIDRFLEAGFRAVTVAVNDRLLGKEFIGRELDKDFLGDLPDDVDPCGENGEFHTFVYDGPIFSEAVKFQPGDVIRREYDDPSSEKRKIGYWFLDLLPVK